MVTTAAGEIDHAMTANSFTSVSLDPLLALVCVERDSRFHEAVLAADSWAVSFLPEGQCGDRAAGSPRAAGRSKGSSTA